MRSIRKRIGPIYIELVNLFHMVDQCMWTYAIDDIAYYYDICRSQNYIVHVFNISLWINTVVILQPHKTAHVTCIPS